MQLPKGAVLPGRKARSFLNELHSTPRQQRADRAHNGARPPSSPASRNGYSANSLLRIDVPNLLAPRPEEDRSRQHHRAGFSGRSAEVIFVLMILLI